MPTATVNGVRLFHVLTGEAGPPLVLVHGSWGDHTSWDFVVPRLAQRCRVLVHDRRGHGQSERPSGQGSIEEDVADVAALIEQHDLAPAHVAGNSYGASIALRLAMRRPDLVRSLVVHEPPLLDLPLDDPRDARAAREVKGRIGDVVTRLAMGDLEGGARAFFDTVAFAPGTWEGFPPALRQVFIDHAPTFLDEARDPESYTIDMSGLASCPRPALLTQGDQSLPFYAPIVAAVGAALPHADLRVFAGAGHVPHATHPDDYAATVAAFVEAAEAEPA